MSKAEENKQRRRLAQMAFSLVNRLQLFQDAAESSYGQIHVPSVEGAKQELMQFYSENYSTPRQ